jgi:hypothetical protein
MATATCGTSPQRLICLAAREIRDRTTPLIAHAQGHRVRTERWDKLSLYAQTDILEPDNNRVENAIRPVAVGRKNYLFAESHDAAQRSALFYSLLGTCKAHGINPYDWLTDVLRRLSSHPINRIRELLPQHYRA